ncbi:CRISPR-associated endonuclease Cas3'' [Candidatus Methanomethylophilus sp. 1R26]|uniref:CRISPR-associated endonuclease Cas3'' n=1 Tax=Candidatus Methanomethylophilus sp. 1R26 TaxID=1769296 RepID=UPI000736DAA2|nr:CRISPR-associated endonuclease Cas3'' [Candidatus Methanomethylophilus sp. 1R26]
MPANIAHIREDGDSKVIQTLEDHLEGTAELASTFLSKVGLVKTGRLLGLLHDLGKATEVFNQYVAGNSDASRGEIDHSTAGAQYLFDSHPETQNPKTAEDSFKKTSLQMMELAIASHHSGLIDCITEDGRNRYWERMVKKRRRNTSE